MLFFKRNWSLFFISGSSFFFVIHANVDFKIKSKERIGVVVVVFLSLKSGWLSDLLPKRTRTWNAKFHPGWHEGVDVRTDVLRTDDFLRTKILRLGCIVYQIFLPMVLCCERSTTKLKLFSWLSGSIIESGSRYENLNIKKLLFIYYLGLDFW